MTINNFKQLEVWRLAHNIVLNVYRHTEELRYYFILCGDLDYLQIDNQQLLEIESVAKMLNKLYTTVNSD